MTQRTVLVLGFDPYRVPVPDPRHAPQASIAFNSSPEGSADAAARSLADA
jgi:hypothetical protein